MKVEKLAIPEVLLITPPKFGDSRGFFSETFNAKKLAAAAGIDGVFVQDNHSLSNCAPPLTGTNRMAAE